MDSCRRRRRNRQELGLDAEPDLVLRRADGRWFLRMRLEDASIGKRFIITMIIVLAILFALALYGFLTGGWQDQSKVSRFELASKNATTIGLITYAQSVALAQGQPIDVYVDIPPDTRLLALDKQALDQAYLARVIRLFDIWLSSTQGQDATAFQNGLRIARRGYDLASEALAKREAEIQKQIQPKPQEQR